MKAKRVLISIIIAILVIIGLFYLYILGLASGHSLV